MDRQYNYNINLDKVRLLGANRCAAPDRRVQGTIVHLAKGLIDLENETITLEPHQGYTIPRGVVHRTRAPARTAILMVEGGSVKPTGDGD